MADRIFSNDELRIKVTDRSVNRSKKGETGVSWELKDRFQEWLKTGKIYEVDGNGVWDKYQADGLGNKLAEIHKHALTDDAYWKNMPIGKGIKYSEEKMIELLTAAGYALPENITPAPNPTPTPNPEPIIGKDGKDGVDGKDGKNGKDGANGKDGKNGEDGSIWPGVFAGIGAGVLTGVAAFLALRGKGKQAEKMAKKAQELAQKTRNQTANITNNLRNDVKNVSAEVDAVGAELNRTRTQTANITNNLRNDVNGIKGKEPFKPQGPEGPNPPQGPKVPEGPEGPVNPRVYKPIEHPNGVTDTELETALKEAENAGEKFKPNTFATSEMSNDGIANELKELSKQTQTSEVVDRTNKLKAELANRGYEVDANGNAVKKGAKEAEAKAKAEAEAKAKTEAEAKAKAEAEEAKKAKEAEEAKKAKEAEEAKKAKEAEEAKKAEEAAIQAKNAQKQISEIEKAVDGIFEKFKGNMSIYESVLKFKNQLRTELEEGFAKGPEAFAKAQKTATEKFENAKKAIAEYTEKYEKLQKEQKQAIDNLTKNGVADETALLNKRNSFTAKIKELYQELLKKLGF